jgi:hypothetical protein
VDRLRELARALNVRVEYLVTGEEPRRADAWVVVKRYLWQVDGIFEQWSPPSGVESRRAERAFKDAFGRARFKEYERLKPIAHMMVGDIFARIMYCYRSNGHAGLVADAAERGKLARAAVDYYYDRACRIEPRAAFDNTPWSTRAWVNAIASDMERWENGRPPPANPFARD